MNLVRVVLVDDHEIVRAGVRLALESRSDIEVVGEATSVSAAANLVVQHRPDVVVLDIDLREGSPIAMLRELSAGKPDVRILVLTAHEDKESVLSALESGASGYLLKRVSSQALAGAVDMVSKGQSVVDPALTRRMMDWMLDPATARPGVVTELTEQQLAILALVAEGLSNKEVADRLYLAEKTVKNHLTRIMARLGVKSRTQAAAFAWRALGSRNSHSTE